jgi:hypothetical protein
MALPVAAQLQHFLVVVQLPTLAGQALLMPHRLPIAAASLQALQFTKIT